MCGKLFSVAGEAAEGSFFLFTGSAISLVILAFQSIFVARLLGPEVYGLLSIVLIPSGLFGMFLDWGVSAALTKFSAQFKEEGKGWLVAHLIKTGLLVKLISSLVAFTFAFLLSDFLAVHLLKRPELGFFIRLASLLLVLSSVLGASTSILIGLGRMEQSASIEVLHALSRALASPLLVFLGFGLLGALTGYLLSYLVSALAGAYILLVKHYRALSNPGGMGAPKINHMSGLRMMLAYGLPLYASGIVGGFVGQYQGVLMAWFIPNTEIGNYTTTTNFLTLLGLVSGPMATALFPAFSRFNVEREEKELQNLFRTAVKYTSLVVIPAAAITMLLSKDLVYTLYGSQYAMAPLFLTLSALGSLYAGLGSLVLGSFLTGVNETKLIFKMTLISSILFIASSFPLISYLRVPGLIISGLISGSASLLYGLHKAHRKFKVSIDLLASTKIYAASLLSLIPTYLILSTLALPWSICNLLLGGCVFLLSYLTSAPLIRAISPSDLENLKGILGQVKYVGPIFKVLLRFEEKVLRQIR